MKILGATKRDTEEKILIDILTMAGFIVAAGAIMWLSIFYVSLGSKLVILGAILVILSWPSAKLISSLINYYEIVCPECLNVNQVSHSAARFCCEQCGGSLFGRNYWRQKYSAKVKDAKLNKSFETGKVVEVAELVEFKVKEMS